MNKTLGQMQNHNGGAGMSMHLSGCQPPMESPMLNFQPTENVNSPNLFMGLEWSNMVQPITFSNINSTDLPCVDPHQLIETHENNMSDQNPCQIDISLADRLSNPDILDKCSLDNGTITISMENLLENNSSQKNVQNNGGTSDAHQVLESCALDNIENCPIEKRLISIDDAMDDSMETTRNVLLSEMEEGCMTLGISGCSRDDDDISIDSDLLTLKPRIRDEECCESDVE
ncbi:unnamed protein product [Ceutorhynchus assimilis]|uniref:Uncharacterized protein n=1 Tax=Ceutorhynchus assimilis TaxID=467358 RepID=A0A9N9MM19_9CUCU|nr:unnamed protein product [Ceutorhynchus assimilis]